MHPLYPCSVLNVEGSESGSVEAYIAGEVTVLRTLTTPPPPPPLRSHLRRPSAIGHNSHIIDYTYL